MAPTKLYAADRSPLHGIRSKRRLAEVLRISPQDLSRLVADLPNLYRSFKAEELGRKPRFIQEPIGALKIVHLRLHRLLQRIESPDYLVSGKKRLSNIDNAKKHQGRRFVLTADIASFYPSCRREFVFRYFRYSLRIEPDIAWILTDLVTVNGAIPTGSHLSQDLAYWSYAPMFDEINELAIRNAMHFSLYVDDMTFSSVEPIPGEFHLQVNATLKRYGLRLKPNKVRKFGRNAWKIVTGCAISPDGELRIRNRHRLNVVRDLQAIRKHGAASHDRANGRISAARLVEPDAFEQSLRQLRHERRSRQRPKQAG